MQLLDAVRLLLAPPHFGRTGPPLDDKGDGVPLFGAPEVKTAKCWSQDGIGQVIELFGQRGRRAGDAGAGAGGFSGRADDAAGVAFYEGPGPLEGLFEGSARPSGL